MTNENTESTIKNAIPEIFRGEDDLIEAIDGLVRKERLRGQLDAYTLANSTVAYGWMQDKIADLKKELSR